MASYRSERSNSFDETLISLADRRLEVLARTELHGSAFCREWSAVAEDYLVDLFLSATGGEAQAEPGVCLLAVGGFGRGQLCPGSDLDLVLVHEGKDAKPGKNAQSTIKMTAEALWYPLWDQGIELDHSVRTLKQVLAVAEADLRAALGLLDARPIAGDLAFGAEVARRARVLWASLSKRWLPALGAAVTERHTEYGDVAFLLEPDLKSGRGGLRDFHALRSASLATPVVAGVLDDPMLLSAAEDLLAVRVELQRRTAKHQDRLVVDEQARVADALGLSGADELMTAVSRAARHIAWASDDGWRRIRSARRGPRGREGSADRPIDRDLVLRDGEVTLTAGVEVGDDPSLPLRAAIACTEHGALMGRHTQAKLSSETPAPTDPWPPELRQALVRLLGLGHPAIHSLETLDQCGLLVRLLPEWAPVRSRPQHNPYHRFTVDRHLMETAANASELVPRVGRPDLLLVGALLHDLGKGYPGDHTDVGQKLVAVIAERMGFTPADVATLVKLVRLHLLLSEAAVRRDLDDPDTIATVADAMENPGSLELLAALTEADSRATGPSMWSNWKAGLLNTLVERTAVLLDRRQAEASGGPEAVVAAGGPPRPTPGEQELSARGELNLSADGMNLTVVTADRPGVLATVAGVLALHGLEVLTATVLPSDSGGASAEADERGGASAEADERGGASAEADERGGASAEAGGAGGPAMCVQRFELRSTFGDDPDWARITGDVIAAGDGRLRLADRLAAREAGMRRRQAHVGAVRVLVDNDASGRASVVEVRAPDRAGTLYRITAALAGAGLSILWARADTMGASVVDTFYVHRAGGGKVEDLSEVDRLRAAVTAAVG